MKWILTIVVLSLSASIYAAELEVEIKSVSNVKGNGSLEVCGVVKDQGTSTSLVTIKHDVSYYTTLTDTEGRWCQLVKRWTYRGKVEATAREL